MSNAALNYRDKEEEVRSFHDKAKEAKKNCIPYIKIAKKGDTIFFLTGRYQWLDNRAY